MNNTTQPIYTVTRRRIAYTVDAKLDNMRKPAEWVIYPVSDIESVTIQSDTRIARINLITGEGVISASRSGGAYSVHLMKALGAKAYQFPKALCDAIMESPVVGHQVHLSATQATYTGGF